MTFPNIFSKSVADQVVARINQLQPDTQPAWGKMNVSQMVAHCCVVYEFVYENIHPRPNAFMRFLLKLIAKKTVTGDAPYPRNTATAPVMKITDERDLEKERQRLIQYIYKTQQLGETHFDGKENMSFGTLTSNEWNTMFYKHLDHHLTQFGV